MSILLTGPPGTSKTGFLLKIFNGTNGAYFMDASNITSAGMNDYLLKHDTKYLLIDEIDKMKSKDQVALLNVMETGILSETNLTERPGERK